MPAGDEGHVRPEGVDRAGAGDGEGEGRPPGEIEDARHEAVRRFLELEIERKLARRVRVLGLEREAAPGRLHAVDGQLRLERSIGELAASFDGQGRSRPGDLCGDLDNGHRQLADAQGHGHVRQGEVGGGSRLDALGGKGAAEDLDRLRLEKIDLEPLRQEGEAAPDEMRTIEPKPDAAAVGDRDGRDPHVRGQGAVDRAERDLAIGRRDRLLDEAHEARLVERSRRPGARAMPEDDAGR